MKNDKIDFVIIWVDGNDKEWLKEKAKYSSNKLASTSVDDSAARYRDWDNLQYWFRGIEKFAPWVNRIHFVTQGHLPAWLDVSSPKLNIVKHEDFIPKKYLPTFSSHPIELNLHRIKGLSENFVYFNDDMFIINTVASETFFENNLPKYRAVLNAIVPSGDNEDPMPGIEMSNMRVLNRNFNKNEVLKRNPGQWFNLKYGVSANIRTLLSLPYAGFTGFYSDHLPVPMLKSTFKEVWKKEFETLDEVSSHRFRNDRDVNQYLMRTWQMCKGDFIPVNIDKIGRAYFLPEARDSLKKSIEDQSYSTICINDSDDIDDFEEIKAEIATNLEKILPNKSGFEL